VSAPLRGSWMVLADANPWLAPWATVLAPLRGLACGPSGARVSGCWDRGLGETNGDPWRWWVLVAPPGLVDPWLPVNPWLAPWATVLAPRRGLVCGPSGARVSGCGDWGVGGSEWGFGAVVGSRRPSGARGWLWLMRTHGSRHGLRFWRRSAAWFVAPPGRGFQDVGSGEWGEANGNSGRWWVLVASPGLVDGFSRCEPMARAMGNGSGAAPRLGLWPLRGPGFRV
jgi:hypothetical protein